MKAVFLRFKWIIIVYLFFIVLWWAAQFFRSNIMDYFDCEPFNLGNGFYISWMASLLQDLIFFGAIGFISLVLSTKLPQDEKFDIRVESIANGKKVGGIARRYLNKSIKDLLVYNDNYVFKVVIISFDKTTNIAEIYAEGVNVCTNMCKDVAYPLNTSANVEPTLAVNGDYGHVSLLKIYEEGNPANINTIIEGQIEKVPANGFARKVNFDVPPDGAAIWKFCYSIWQTINGNKANSADWYYIEISGFTEKFTIHLINKTPYAIKYDFNYTDRENNDVFVNKTGLLIDAMTPGKPSEQTILQNAHSIDKDKFSLFFYY